MNEATVTICESNASFIYPLMLKFLQDLKESLEQAAADAMSLGGFVYDERTGLYYDWNTGYYYDPVSFEACTVLIIYLKADLILKFD